MHFEGLSSHEEDLSTQGAVKESPLLDDINGLQSRLQSRVDAGERPELLAQLDGEETVSDVSEGHDNSELLAEVESVLGDFEDLEDSEGNIIDGYDVFSTYIKEKASVENQESFIDFETGGFIYDAIVETGKFPVNDFEFEAMLTGDPTPTQQQQIDGQYNRIAEANETATLLAELEADVKSNEVADRESAAIDERVADEKFEEASDSKKQIQELMESVGTLSLSPELKKLFEDFSGIGEITNELTKEEINEIIALKKNIVKHLTVSNELTKSILPQALESGKFAQVESALLGLSPEFKVVIEKFKVGEIYRTKTFPLEQQYRASAALGTEVSGDEGFREKADQSGNIFTIKTDSGEEINYDIITNERTLSVNGYALSSQLEDKGDYQTPKLEYMKVEQKLLPQIELIQQIAQTLTDKEVTTDETAEIRATISQIPGYDTLGINFDALDGKEIQTRLAELLLSNQTDLKEARDNYREELEGLRSAHMAALERKDKKVKETLRYLESIGFTDIPQYITDQIIDTLNSNDGLRSSLGFTEKINLAEGELGMDKTAGEGLEIDNADKAAFAEFVNKMLGFTEENGINISAIRNGTGAPISDRASFQTRIRESGIQDVGGVQKMLDNLQRVDGDTSPEAAPEGEGSLNE